MQANPPRRAGCGTMNVRVVELRSKMKIRIRKRIQEYEYD
jgi:hypothetical protein